MMNIIMRILILVGMVTLFTTVWGSDNVFEPNKDKNSSSHNRETRTPNDVTLTVEQCQASSHHELIYGRYIDVENNCLRQPEPVGCMIAYSACDTAIGVAKAPNGKKCYWFSDLCFPNGWQELVNDGGDPSCPGDYTTLSLCPYLIATTFRSTSLKWDIGQANHAGFRVWRVVEEGSGRYTNIITLKELNSSQGECLEGRLIAHRITGPGPLLSKALSDSKQKACYSFVEIEVANNQTYYYLLEEVLDAITGKSIFHCDDIVAVTVGDGLPINLTAAKDYCRQVTGSQD